MAGFPGSCSTDVLAEAVKHCNGMSLCLGLSFPTCDSTFLWQVSVITSPVPLGGRRLLAPQPLPL